MENNQTGFKTHEGKWCLKRYILKLIGALIILLVLGLIVNNAVKLYGSESNPNTIVINGIAKISSVPDISTVRFTIRESRADNNTKVLQEAVAKKAEGVFTKLKALGIEKEDIQTSNYSVSPKYSYRDCHNRPQPCESRYVSGYEASESVNIKVRNTENVSEVLNILAEEKVTEVDGPSFEIDDVEKLKDEARNLAIKDAKEKAEVLAKSLGVKIKKIVSFSDSNGGYPMPLYAQAMGDSYLRKEASAQNMAPNIEEGSQEIVSNVSITFQISN